MTRVSDQHAATAGLSRTSCRMLELRDTVFAEWEARVRISLDKAKDLSHPILIDTLPALYDNIAQSLTLEYPRLTGGEGTTLASEHGGERARITAYDHETLIGEYQLFRWVIFDVFEREGLRLTTLETRAINASIDAGIQESVCGFVLVHNTLRERFAAAVAHDLRGPLGVTSSALQLILMTNDPTRMKTVAAKALDQIHRMSAMIHELLDTMAFHSGQQITLDIAHFDINEVINEVMVDTIARHGARIQAISTPIRGWWDRQAMKRALENMVSNALKYGQQRTLVVIRAGEGHERLLLSVHNDGNPIPLQEQETIFQMYCRTKSARNTHQQGWGVGLPYVRAVAESHGGSIALDSSAERGTTFTIDVPIDSRPYGSGAPTLA